MEGDRSANSIYIPVYTGIYIHETINGTCAFSQDPVTCKCIRGSSSWKPLSVWGTKRSRAYIPTCIFTYSLVSCVIYNSCATRSVEKYLTPNFVKGVQVGYFKKNSPFLKRLHCNTVQSFVRFRDSWLWIITASFRLICPNNIFSPCSYMFLKQFYFSDNPSDPTAFSRVLVGTLVRPC